jgi:hypothetical protein
MKKWVFLFALLAVCAVSVHPFVLAEVLSQTNEPARGCIEFQIIDGQVWEIDRAGTKTKLAPSDPRMPYIIAGTEDRREEGWVYIMCF